MKRIVALVLVAIVMLALTGCGLESDTIGSGEQDEPTATTTAAEDLLTPADVEGVSGLTGLQVVPYDPAIGAGGDINIADASGQLVAMLVEEGPETWEAWLTDGFTVGESYSPPVGDESFIGPNPDVSATPYIFGFRKGDTAIVLDTYFADGTSATVLSIDQLRALAQIVESRL